MSFVVAIDGPAGSGKGTITEIISKKLNLTNIGTGSAYRCIALETLNRGINLEEIQKIVDMLDNIDIEFNLENGEDIVYLNKQNVTRELRTQRVSKIVSQISSIKEVRIKLNDLFRRVAKGKNVIMEGRDIGTCVFPNADVKIYLDATPEERANRRYKQNQDLGIDMSYDEILKNINMRDENDKSKEFGALKQAEDAIYIDSSNMSIDEVANKVIEIINNKIK